MFLLAVDLRSTAKSNKSLLDKCQYYNILSTLMNTTAWADQPNEHEPSAEAEVVVEETIQDGFVISKKKKHNPKNISRDHEPVSESVIPAEYLQTESKSNRHHLSGFIRHIMCKGAPATVKQNPVPMTIKNFWTSYKNTNHIISGGMRINVDKQYCLNHFTFVLSFYNVYVISNYNITTNKYSIPLDPETFRKCVSNVRSIVSDKFNINDVLVDYYISAGGLIPIPVKLFVDNYHDAANALFKKLDLAKTLRPPKRVTVPAAETSTSKPAEELAEESTDASASADVEEE